MWGPESQVVWMSALAYGLTRDVLGLRRSIADLTRLIEAGFRLTPQLELARGEYLRERGELEASRTALEMALCLAPDDDAQLHMPALSALAETWLALDRPAEAILAATKAIALCDDEAVKDVTWRTRARRALALAEAAQGDTAAAVARLDAALVEALPFGSPTLSGSLHEARAKIALSTGDTESYALHRNATESWFRATKNPALIARVQRLPDPAERRGMASEGGAEVTALASPAGRAEALRTLITADVATLAQDGDEARWVSAVLSGCRGPIERAARSLELLIEASGGAAGYLYLYQGGELHLLAPTYGEEPPELLVNALARIASEVESVHAAATMELGWQPDAVPGDVTWVRALLCVVRGGPRVAIGAVAIVCDATKATVPPRALLDQVAAELYQAGDVTLGSGAISASAEEGAPSSRQSRERKLP